MNRKFDEIKTDGQASGTITNALITRLQVMNGSLTRGETLIIVKELRKRIESHKLIPYDPCPSCKVNLDSWEGECTDECECKECLSQHSTDCKCDGCLARRADFEDYMELEN